MSKIVRKTFADSPLTPARKRRLAKLAARPEQEIDCTDIAPLSDEFWANAVRNPFYRPILGSNGNAQALTPHTVRFPVFARAPAPRSR